MRRGSILLTALVLLSAPLAAVSARADGVLSLAVDKAEILRLPAPAVRVIVANPAIADVTVEKPTLITLFGKSAGETSLMVLGADDKTILSRTVVVTGAGDHTVTVHAPGGQGPVSREYACVGNHCSKVETGNATQPGSAAPASPTQPR